MSSKYCVCGKANDALSNFCSACGSKFVSFGSIKAPKEEEVKPKRLIPKKVVPRAIEAEAEEDDEIEGEGGEVIPDITGLEVEIIPSKVRGESIANLMSSGSGKTSFKRDESTSTKRQLLKEFYDEAKSIKSK